jgi:hypothetical protein
MMHENQAFEQFSELGSGSIYEGSWDSWCRRFIGEEQKRFINEIGFDTTKNIEQAIEELKETI